MRWVKFFIPFGTAFIAAPAFAGYVLTTLASFNGSTTGSGPVAGVIISGSTLYGTTSGGGSIGDGEVFSLPITGGTPTVLASFGGTNGNSPQGNLALSGSTLYGVTYEGGANNEGEIFSVPVGGGSPTVLASFDGTHGAYPLTGVVPSGGRLYGATPNGGSSGSGVVFSAPIGGGTPTVLATFNGTNGAYPESGVILSGSTLYGTTSDQEAGGTSDLGQVFSVAVSGGTPHVLASFSGLNGNHPIGLTLSGSTLYGTTMYGGASGINGSGEVFSLPVSGGSPTVLASFTGANGANPSGNLTISGSTLYGTTKGGGANHDGEVFSLPEAGGTPTILASFSGTNGATPLGDLALQGSTLYGTTLNGGAFGHGTVFSLSHSVISLTAAAPTTFGNSLGTLSITGHNGSYAIASEAFSSTQSGYVLTSAWNPTTDTEIYALKISDSVSANLNTDLAALVDQIDGRIYSGFSVISSITDPTDGAFTNISPGGFNFFITINGPTLGASSDQFGFDLSEFSANSDVLSASAIAVIPEPTTALLLLTCMCGVMRRHRKTPHAP